MRLISRNGRDHTRRFPELVKALGRLKPKTFTLDGEVAVFDKGLISRFEWLRGRPKDEPATLPVYIAFDVLELAGRDLRGRPLKERRRVLERLVWHHRCTSPNSASLAIGECTSVRHHYLHHKHPNKNFNVVLPLADYVLGTNIRASNSELNEMYRLRLL